ncbi:testicular acid phosphatase [Ixodes scapularis]|uniref:testicular acid phosphatase n=1 Tax=Ixodes scapularis TaxID=6945 RepID=UPI001C3908E5|nr:testicular acid phosphatase [Ixodes scapularis]
MVHPSMQAFCLLVVSSSHVCVDADQNEFVPRDLDVVIGLLRHGDRAPLGTFPTDLNPNSTYWKYGYGNLTDRGIETMRNVGKYVRERYQGFLTDDPEETQVRSSFSYRCVMSALLLLEELYPSKSPDESNLARMPEDNDKYTLICEPQIKKQLLKLLDPFSGLLDLTWFLIRATHELGLSLLSDATKVPEGLDAVQVEKEYGLSIPSWFEDRLDLLSYNSRRLYALIAQALIRNMGGELLRDISTLLEDRYQLAGNNTKNAPVAIPGLQNATRHSKFLLFSYHDLNIMATLMALNETFSQKPHYGSLVLFQVTKKDQSEPEITILYRNGTAEPEVFPIVGCPMPCSVNKFIKVVRDQFPEAFTAESCGLPSNYTIL